LAVKDAFGCTSRQFVSIAYTPLPQLQLQPADTLVCYHEDVRFGLYGQVDRIASTSWNIPASGLSAQIIGTQSQQILVNVRDRDGCITHDTAMLRVKACNPPGRCIAIPNAFTPNQDGRNETAGPLINGCHVTSLHFEIYNRWGQRLFETDRTGIGWNGRYLGQDAPAGIYVYRCTYVGDDGVTQEQKGTILLIR
jgi:gliding motility-associated-like protein